MLVSRSRPTRFSDRGAENDVAEAKAAFERLTAAPADEGLYRDRYRDMARTLGFEGHIAWAEAMP